jgi:hypothetical protein
MSSSTPSLHIGFEHSMPVPPSGTRHTRPGPHWLVVVQISPSPVNSLMSIVYSPIDVGSRPSTIR